MKPKMKTLTLIACLIVPVYTNTLPRVSTSTTRWLAGCTGLSAFFYKMGAINKQTQYSTRLEFLNGMIRYERSPSFFENNTRLNLPSNTNKIIT